MRGRCFAPVPGQGTRPTAERVREALFSRLQSRYRLAGARLLDLFAGTGALGIEALSRGVAQVDFVEPARAARMVLEKNIETLGLAHHALVVAKDFRLALGDALRAQKTFHGVFVDAPYALGVEEELLEYFAGGTLLAPGAWISVETARKRDLPEQSGDLSKCREDRYGDSKLVLYELGN